MDQAVDEGDDAGGLGKTSFHGKGLIGAQQKGLCRVVAPGDDLEEEIGVATVVGAVSDLVDAELGRRWPELSCACSRKLSRCSRMTR